MSYTRFLATISILILFSSFLCIPIKIVLADSTREEIIQQKQVAEQQAELYLNQFEKRQGYGNFSATSTDESGLDRKTQIAQAEQSMESQALDYLKKIAMPNHVSVPAASTDESGLDRKAEIAQAEQLVEKQAQKNLQTRTGPYGQFNVISTDESGLDRKAEIAQDEQLVEKQVQQNLLLIQTLSYGYFNATGTDESGIIDKKSEIMQTEQTMELNAKNMMEKMYPKLGFNEYGQ